MEELSLQGGTHIGVASGSPYANLLPFLQFQPDKIILLISNHMESKSQNLELVLKEAFPNIDIKTLKEFPDNNPENIQSFLNTHKEYFEGEDNFRYHISGGTKPMMVEAKKFFESFFSEKSNYLSYGHL